MLQPTRYKNLISSSFHAAHFRILIGNIKSVLLCAPLGLETTKKSKLFQPLLTSKHRTWAWSGILDRAVNRTVFKTFRKCFKK